MFKLHRASEREISKVAESIAALGNVNWVARFDGYFDLGCTVVVRNTGELSTFVDEVRKKFHRNLRESSYAVNIHAEFYPRHYLVARTRSGDFAASYSSFSQVAVLPPVDSTDLEVLRGLNDDARATTTDLAGLAHEFSNFLEGCRLEGPWMGLRKVALHVPASGNCRHCVVAVVSCER